MHLQTPVWLFAAACVGTLLGAPLEAGDWVHPFDFPQAEAFPDELFVVVEIPAQSATKYEIDKRSGHIFVDRFVSMPVSYPANYGSIPQTLLADGDPLDVLVFTRAPLHPGVMVKVRPVGVLLMLDDGETDDKILAVPAGDVDPTYDRVRSPEDLPAMDLQRVKSFFEIYKRLARSRAKVELAGIEDADKARGLARAAFDRYHSAKAEKR